MKRGSYAPPCIWTPTLGDKTFGGFEFNTLKKIHQTVVRTTYFSLVVKVQTFPTSKLLKPGEASKARNITRAKEKQKKREYNSQFWSKSIKLLNIKLFIGDFCKIGRISRLSWDRELTFEIGANPTASAAQRAWTRDRCACTTSSYTMSHVAG